VPPKLRTRWTWTRLVNEVGVDCGFRHDLVDGELFVAPSPNYLHQIVAQRLLLTLLPAAPPTLQVVGLPLNLYIDYWIIDPLAPSIVVLQRDESGSYEEVTSARGDEALLVDEPFAASITPSQLVIRR
jgi:hypothetical protein